MIRSNATFTIVLRETRKKEMERKEMKGLEKMKESGGRVFKRGAALVISQL